MPYTRIVLQMVLMGLGLGLTATPATESILSVLPAAKAGVGSAVNDATREAGGTLGVAVIGSVFTSLWTSSLDTGAFAALPEQAREAARGSVAAALQIASTSPAAVRVQLVSAMQDSFMSGLHVACLVAAGVCWAGALGALALPGRRPADAVAVPVLEPAAA
jgi:hypothetical protein